MTSLSLAECCRLLAIDPKTLRQWLAQAQMAWHTDPANAKIKCLEVEQVQTLVGLHGRVLQFPAAASAATATTSKAQSQMFPTTLPDTDLRARLAQMEAQIATLHTQLTDLTLQRLQERTLRYEQRLQIFEARMAQERAAPAPLPRPVPPSEHQLPMHAEPHLSQPKRLKTRVPSGLISLVEYGGGGRYVIICPTRGELALIPDSVPWFEWLATLSSFRFIGQHGRLSASRPARRTCWMAYRRIHSRCYAHSLGPSQTLTLGRLEQMAARLQSYVSV